MMKTASSPLDILRESLGTLPEPVANPPLVMVSGLPGTGKSYFCRYLLERADTSRDIRPVMDKIVREVNRK
ncbi:MAG: hypothetical protein QGG56_04015 [Dehalococcoidia bacterium]|nr:hypothetical protein [Dehalococcoidia bacterium]